LPVCTWPGGGSRARGRQGALRTRVAGALSPSASLRYPGPLPILRGSHAAELSRSLRAAPAAGREARPLPRERAWNPPQRPAAGAAPLRARVPGGVRDPTVTPRPADSLARSESASRRGRRTDLRTVAGPGSPAAESRSAARLAREPPVTRRLPRRR